MTTLFALLTVQAMLGLADNVINHEWKLGLPYRRSARREMLLHGLRHYAYAIVFAGLAWFEWHGLWAGVLGAVLLAETLITIADFLEEDRTRSPLPAGERVLHTVLTLLYGAFLALMAPVLAGWWDQPTGLAAFEHAVFSPLFTVFAVGVLAWGTRDFIAALRSYRAPAWWRSPMRVGPSRGNSAVLVTGATGFIGRRLVRALVARGEQVIVSTRNREHAEDLFGPYAEVVENPDEIPAEMNVAAVVNLAGAPIMGLPWTARRRATLLQSRTRTTQDLVDWMRERRTRPRVLLSASAIGFYGAIDGDRTVTERDPPANQFQSKLCARWEAEALTASDLGVRVAILRLGLVLGSDGGSYPAMTAALRLGLGMLIGRGDQWMSWIHVRDAVNLALAAIDDARWQGPINAVAPIPVTQAGFMDAVAGRLGRRVRGRVPATLVQWGLGEMATLLVDGQRVIATRALANGFRFRHSTIESAVADLERTADTPRSVEVFYNGNCPLCNAEMQRYRRLMLDDPHLRFVDVFERDSRLDEYRLEFHHVESRLHTRDNLGRVSTGMDAMRVLWARMPGFRHLVPLTRVPGVRLVLDAAYDAVVAPLMTWLGRRHCASDACAVRS